MDESGLAHATAQADASAATASPSLTPTDAPHAPFPLSPMATGLVVGHAEDPAELDADRRADAALGQLGRLVRRSPASGGTPAVGYAGGPVPGEVANRIERLRGYGESLPGATRARMEQGFGTSFAGVRVHVGEEPARLNRLVSAEAFTVGRDVFFGAGRFDPGSPDGERVLAHELAHTLQPAAAVRRTPAAVAASATATTADLETGDAQWKALREATVAYSALATAKYVERAAKLVEIDRLAGEWEKVVRAPSQVEVEVQRQTARTSALAALRALVATEHRELAAVGMPVDESKQTLSNRFKGDYLLEQVITGRATLGPGDKSVTITKIQQALADLGDLATDKVTGTVDADATAAIKKYQKRKALAETGIVDQATLTGLSTEFAKHAVEATLAKGTGVAKKETKPEYTAATAPAGLLAGTHDLSAGDKAAALAAVKTRAAAAPGGVAAEFQPDLPAGNFGERLTEEVERIILWEWGQMGKDKAAQRGDLLRWKHIEEIAAVAKFVTDAVFGSYAVGPPLTPGVSIHDAWETRTAEVAGSKKLADEAAYWRVQKIITGGQWAVGIAREHGVDQSRAPEKAIIAQVRSALIAKHYAKLLETHRGWVASSAEGKVFLQRFLAPDAVKQRDKLWLLFATIVHEYLHTLEHSVSRAHRDELAKTDDDSAFTLREGITEYLTQTVLETVDYADDELRDIVEGDYHVDLTHPIPKRQSYAGQRVGAEKLAGIVGARNVMASFFLGEIEKIGRSAG